MKNKERTIKIKAFLRAFLITIIFSTCVIAFLSGIVIADQNTRALINSQTTPAIDVKMNNDLLTIDFLGKKLQLDFSFTENVKKITEPIAVLIPVEYRLSGIGIYKLPDMISNFIKEYIKE